MTVDARTRSRGSIPTARQVVAKRIISVTAQPTELEKGRATIYECARAHERKLSLTLHVGNQREPTCTRVLIVHGLVHRICAPHYEVFASIYVQENSSKSPKEVNVSSS